MTITRGNGGPPHQLGISSRYGSTIFGGLPDQPAHRPEDIISGKVARAGLYHETQARDQLTEIVSGFINNITEHVVSRVVEELKPHLVEGWMVAQMRHHLAAQRAKDDPSSFEHWNANWNALCEHQRRGLETCPLKSFQVAIAAIAGAQVVEGSEMGCGFRIAIDDRVFSVTDPFSWRTDLILIGEIVGTNEALYKGTHEVMITLVRALVEGVDMTTAVEVIPGVARCNPLTPFDIDEIDEDENED